MSKSAQEPSTENPSSSVQKTEIDDQNMPNKMAHPSKENSQETRIKRLESVEKVLDQIFIDDQDQKIMTDESFNFTKKKLKQLKNFVSLSKENSQETRIKRLELEFIEKELDQIFIESQDQKIEADESLDFVKKKLKQVKSLVSQFKEQQRLEKRPSFSDQPQPSKAKEFRKMSEDWQNLRVEKHILASPMMNNLTQGYDLLESYSRICILSFAVFPENAIIKKRPLIYWWMAEGFVMTSEEGESSFRELIKKGIIQPWFKNDKTPMVDSCALHPWIRRTLISKARKAEIFDFDDVGRITCRDTKSRRLFFPMDGKVSSSEREFWTMFNVNESYLNFSEDFLSKFEKVKILQLGSWQSSLLHHIEVENDKFLNDLGALKHLKYLSLRGISLIITLPSSITECRNLEILDLKGCHALESLPSDIGSLRKLTHLDFSECHLLENMPHNQHKLLLLQVLKGFDAEKYSYHRSIKSSTSLSAFSQLEKLRKLSVIVGTKSYKEVVDDLRCLFSIKNLRILTVTWRMVSTNPVEQPEREEEDKNQYHNLENLEKLELRCFPFRKRPFWLSPNILKKLKKLYIRGGLLEELTPQITKDGEGKATDNKWNVEILRLKHLKKLKLTSDQVKKFFPHVCYFEFGVSRQNASEKYDGHLWWSARQGSETFPEFQI